MNPSYGGGTWSATSSSVGEWRWLYVLNPGWFSSLDVGEDGQLRQIDTSYYDQLSLRMRIESGGVNGSARIMWSDDVIGSYRGWVDYYPANDGRWHIYTFDFRSESTWSGPLSSLWLELPNLKSGYLVEIDWIRLTPTQNRTVSWTGSGSDNVDVYLGSDPTFSDANQYSQVHRYSVSSNTATYQETEASTGTFVVPASLSGGTYYARVVDGSSADNSSNAWAVVPVPIAEIVAPSYVSGEDWATTVAGDPWDMDSVGDIDPNETQTLNYSASGGVLDIVNNDDGNDPCEGAWPHRPLGLNLHGRRIDTSKYRYFTYRYKVDDAPDQGDGGVSRVRWLDTDAWAAGRTDDISLYNDGWNTYKIDLATVDLEAEPWPWQSYNYNALHIIAHESHDPWTSHLDWVKLTAENEARGAYTVGWNLHNVTEVDKTTICWDDDNNPDNGVVSGSCQEVTEPVPGTPEPPPGPLYTYVPLVTRYYGSGALEVEAEHQFTVSTIGLTPGQRYYIVVRLEDGPHTVDWYSELPVRIVN
jgi:hypothetical protein